MAKVVTIDNEMIRISPTNDYMIEYSLDNGNTWSQRFENKDFGIFQAMLFSVGKLYLQTIKGLYVSLDRGVSWEKRL